MFKMKRILDDVRVVDLTHVWFGPFCTKILANLGAEVIKIEPPWGAMDRIGRVVQFGGASPAFLYLNVDKKGMAINLKTEKGVKIFKELVKISDVVVENFSPGTMDKLGLGWETLKEVNPKIIFASLSGFGQTGPYSPRPSYASIAEALSGHTRLTGDLTDPNGPPLPTANAYGDLAPALWAALSIIAAIRYSDMTGNGQRIDVSQTDCMVALCGVDITQYLLSGLFPWEIRKKYEWAQVRGGIMKAKDGYVRVAAFGRSRDQIAKILGLEEADQEIFIEWVENRTVDEVVTKLVEMSVPVAPILHLDEVVKNPHILARGMFVEVEHPKAGKVKVANFPVKFSESPTEVREPAPLLGQHNIEILSGLLGYSKEEIIKLEKEGVTSTAK